MTVATLQARDPTENAARVRLASATLFLVTSALVVTSLVVPWWTVQYAVPTSSGTESATIYFLPGSSARVLANGVSSVATYTSLGLGGSTGTLYGTVQAVGLIVVVAAAGAGVLTVLLGATKSWRRQISVAVATLGIIAVVGLTLTVGLFPVAESQSLPNGLAFCGIASGGSSPCASFYGSATGAWGSGSWGPGSGWYLAGTSLTSLVAGLLVFALTQRGAWTVAVSGPRSAAVRQHPGGEPGSTEASSAP